MSNFDKVDFVTGMRRMFYIVSPNETSFKTAEEVPPYINEATPFFFMFITIELIISLLKQDKKCRMNDAFTSVSQGMFSKLPMVLVRSITIEGYSWVYKHYCIRELPWENSWTWWLTFLGVDLGYYWFHRLAHEVNFMWAFHQTHHSSEEYNFSTALRQSVLQIYTSWVFYLPMALFVPPSVFLVHQELNILYQFWIHTQGTFQAEQEEVAYGLTHPINTFEPFTIQFGYSKYLLERCTTLRGITNWVKNFLYGPGWLPGKPRTGDINDIPKIEQPVKLYSVKLPQWKSVYVFVHFLLFTVGYQELMARQTGLSQTSVLVVVAYCFYNLTCFGRLFDDSKSANYYELTRCVLFLVGEMVMCKLGFYGDKGFRPWFMYGFQWCFAFSIAIWIAQILKDGNAKEETRQKPLHKEVKVQ